MRLVEASGPRRFRPQPCVSPVRRPCRNPWGQPGRETWRKPIPPRRRPFMNGAVDSQPRRTAVSHAGMRARLIFVAAALIAGSRVGSGGEDRCATASALGLQLCLAERSRGCPRPQKRFRMRSRHRLTSMPWRYALENQKIYREQKRDGRCRTSIRWNGRRRGRRRGCCRFRTSSSTFTGGAHPNTGYSALLWDRGSNREIELGVAVPAAGKLRRSDPLRLLSSPRQGTLQAARRREARPAGIQRLSQIFATWRSRRRTRTAMAGSTCRLCRLALCRRPLCRRRI